MLLQHSSGKRLNLAERDGLKTTSALQAKAEAANAAEQVKNFKTLQVLHALAE